LCLWKEIFIGNKQHFYKCCAVPASSVTDRQTDRQTHTHTHTHTKLYLLIEK